MKIETSRKETTIHLGESYCFNHDKIIDACIYLAAKDYWEVFGESQMQVYVKDKGAFRQYKRLKFALKRF